eukprot:GHVT01086198.1.p1 GENE.GHVT01086198.1~~GHVT01086198.1.p1  ORF type:complete len:234 (+),score=47.82 GHVT01086198.1:723-1424(+)
MSTGKSGRGGGQKKTAPLTKRVAAVGSGLLPSSSEGVGLPAAAAHKHLLAQVATLEEKLKEKDEKLQEVQTRETELRERVLSFASFLGTERVTAFAIQAESVRGFKAAQDRLISEINALETMHEQQTEEANLLQQTLYDMNLEKEQTKQQLYKQINVFRERLDLMSEEFGGMLETLHQSLKTALATNAAGRMARRLPSRFEEKMRNIAEGIKNPHLPPQDHRQNQEEIRSIQR